jgi:hypothetical protein
MEGPAAVLNVITLPPGATTAQARLVLDGVRGAIFLYNNGGPLGALIGSWAKSAGTDPYGNVYPQGLSVALGSITGTTFNAGNIVIDSQGARIYDVAAPGAKNHLILSFSFLQSYADAFNNIVLGPGFAVYNTTSFTACVFGPFATGSGLVFANPTFTLFKSTVDETGAWQRDLVYTFPTTGNIFEYVGGVSLNSVVQRFLNGSGNALGDIQFQNVVGTSGVPIMTPTLDSNAYNMGHFETSAVPAQLINVMSPPVAITGSSVTVGPSSYRITFDMFYHGNQAAGSPHVDTTGGTAAINFLHTWCNFTVPGTSPAFTFTPSTSTLPAFDGPAFGGTGIAVMHLECFVTFGSLGTFQIRGADNIAGDTWTVNSIFVRVEKRQLCHLRSGAVSGIIRESGTPHGKCGPTTPRTGSAVIRHGRSGTGGRRHERN